jgi:FkbM family methyltransferase
VDAASLLSAYEAIFREEIYAFDAEISSPRIIDGGANIGLATLYWKRHFPEAEIIAFEPDPQVFRALSNNIKAHNCSEVTLIQKGLWSEEGECTFQSDGADSGRIDGEPGQEETVHRIPVTRLTPYLEAPTDLLKLDIEGAEVEVLLDTEETLANVERVFVEYHSYVDKRQRLAELIGVLERSGFRVHIQPELVANQPFIDQLESYGMDHRLNIFAYRT